MLTKNVNERNLHTLTLIVNGGPEMTKHDPALALTTKYQRALRGMRTATRRALEAKNTAPNQANWRMAFRRLETTRSQMLKAKPTTAHGASALLLFAARELVAGQHNTPPPGTRGKTQLR